MNFLNGYLCVKRKTYNLEKQFKKAKFYDVPFYFVNIYYEVSFCLTTIFLLENKLCFLSLVYTRTL